MWVPVSEILLASSAHIPVPIVALEREAHHVLSSNLPRRLLSDTTNKKTDSQKITRVALFIPTVDPNLYHLGVKKQNANWVEATSCKHVVWFSFCASSSRRVIKMLARASTAWSIGRSLGKYRSHGATWRQFRFSPFFTSSSTLPMTSRRALRAAATCSTVTLSRSICCIFLSLDSFKKQSRSNTGSRDEPEPWGFRDLKSLPQRYENKFAPNPAALIADTTSSTVPRSNGLFRRSFSAGTLTDFSFIDLGRFGWLVRQQENDFSGVFLKCQEIPFGHSTHCTPFPEIVVEPLWKTLWRHCVLQIQIIGEIQREDFLWLRWLCLTDISNVFQTDDEMSSETLFLVGATHCTLFPKDLCWGIMEGKCQWHLLFKPKGKKVQEEHEERWETCEGIARSNTVSTTTDMQCCMVSTCLSCYWQDLMDWCWHEPTILLILARSVSIMLVAIFLLSTTSAADVFSVFLQ